LLIAALVGADGLGVLVALGTVTPPKALNWIGHRGGRHHAGSNASGNKISAKKMNGPK
jgi:hypothetical protein